MGGDKAEHLVHRLAYPMPWLSNCPIIKPGIIKVELKNKQVFIPQKTNKQTKPPNKLTVHTAEK